MRPDNNASYFASVVGDLDHIIEPMIADPDVNNIDVSKRYTHDTIRPISYYGDEKTVDLGFVGSCMVHKGDIKIVAHMLRNLEKVSGKVEFNAPLIVADPRFTTTAAHADDELLLYVYDGATPVEGASIALDGTEVGVTRRDGSLVADLSEGQHTILVSAPSGKTGNVRFAAGSGQLVDVISDLGSAGPAYVEVYSRLESSADRRKAPTGKLQVTVRVGAEVIPDQTIDISGGQGSIVTDEEGLSLIHI